MSLLNMFRVQQLSSERDGRVHRDLYRWLKELVLRVNTRSVPVGAILPMLLSASDISSLFDASGLGLRTGRFYGWAIANGNNGTQDLTDRFPRFSGTASGGTGGSDTNAHTHDIDHNHGSFTSGSESGHTHTEGDMVAQLTGSIASNFIAFNRVSAPNTWNENYRGTSLTVSGSSTSNNFGTKVDGTTDPGSAHSHSVDVPALGTTQSGAPTDTENRPAFYELVPLQCLELGAP